MAAKKTAAKRKAPAKGTKRAAKKQIDKTGSVTGPLCPGTGSTEKADGKPIKCPSCGYEWPKKLRVPEHVAKAWK
jgi:tRNA(Ile2) C34 agmatinyltransferase TiaS